jgi:hypothetical protein
VGNLLGLPPWWWSSRRSATTAAENRCNGNVPGAENSALNSLVDKVETLIANSGFCPIAAFGRGKLVSRGF